MKPRALVVCPGRGSYRRTSLGSLIDRSDAAREMLMACDEWRRAHERTPITEIDGAKSFRAALHVAGENASLLTFACSMADALEIARNHYEIVGVTGNSMGFYTALAVSGALSLADAIRLVDTMGSYQADNVLGGQLVYPIADADWNVDLRRLAHVDATLQAARDAGFVANWSIRLGGHAVLGACTQGLEFLEAELESIKRKDQRFPMRLPLHSAFHTEVMAATSNRAKQALSDLDFRAPSVPLIDGRGVVHRPRWTDPSHLAEYTLGTQVTTTYDFDLGLATALAHCAPDVVIALGPGNSLGAALAHGLVRESWRGIRSREQFKAHAASTDEAPPLLALGAE